MELMAKLLKMLVVLRLLVVALLLLALVLTLLVQKLLVQKLLVQSAPKKLKQKSDQKCLSAYLQASLLASGDELIV